MILEGDFNFDILTENQEFYSLINRKYATSKNGIRMAQTQSQRKLWTFYSFERLVKLHPILSGELLGHNCWVWD